MSVKEKAPYGTTCNQCGMCCRKTLCDLGQAVFQRTEGPCPALKWEGEDSRCGLVVSPGEFVDPRAPGAGQPEQLSKGAKLLIAAGLACDARMPGEVQPASYRRLLKRLAKRSRYNSILARKKLFQWVGGIDRE